MEKKRKSKRMSLKVYLKVFDRKTDQLFGYLVDITNEGIMVTSEQPIKTEATFQLRLILPTEIEGSKQFSFSAISMWGKKDSDSGFYNNGFQFSNLSTKDVQIIEQLIQKFCFKTD